jgi:diguanylate cyclase (GGDEF)-like protein
VVEPFASVLAAASGAEGLDLARMAVPDLILLDVQMPAMDGFDVINELKHDTTLRHIPVIFITAGTMTEIESECLEAGAVDYISKPVNPRVLLARVRTQLLIKQQADALSELAVIDGTTGAMNRRAFDARLQAESGRAARAGDDLSLLLVDVDALGAYNDIYGHVAGDDVLAAVAEMVGQIARRPADVIARFDGGVLAVLLPSTPEASARVLATQVDSAVRGRALTHRGNAAGVVTVSIGVASSGTESSSAVMVTAAQESLRLAKSHGRDARRRADAMSVRTS